MSTSSVVADLVADAQEFLDGGVVELTEVLEEVAAYGDRPVPAPSPELALLLAGRAAATTARPDRPHPPRGRLRGLVAGLAAAAISGLSLTSAAAVANELPVPIQRVVAHFSEQYLPFSFPRPYGDPPAGHDTTRTRPDPGVPAPSAVPSATPSATPFGTPAGAQAAPRPRDPGAGRTGRHVRVRTTPKAPTAHRTVAPSAGRDGTQGHGTVPASPAHATPPRTDASADPTGASHDPAAGDGSPQPGPATDPKGHVDHGAVHAHKGATGIRPTDQGRGSGGKPAGTGQSPAKGQGAGAGALTTPKAAGVPGAAGPERLDRAAPPSGGRAAAAQDGSGAATP